MILIGICIVGIFLAVCTAWGIYSWQMRDIGEEDE